MMIMTIFIIKNIFNLNKTYLGEYTALRRKYQNYEDYQYDIDLFCPKTNKCLKSLVGWFPSNGATSIFSPKPQNVVGVIIANTPSLVTGYGKFGFHNLLWRLWVMEKFEIRLGEEVYP